MKGFLLTTSFLILLSNSVMAQEARTENLTIYETIKGVVYHNETFFINEQNSPVQISKVTARHVPSSTAKTAEAVWDRLYKYLDDKEKKTIRALARENLQVEISASGERAVAVKFGVIAYDAFKEYLGGLTAVTMDPPVDNMQWDFSPAYLFKFERYGIVGVYVRQARLKDGTIWNFEPDVILKEFSNRVSEITKEQILAIDSE